MQTSPWSFLDIWSFLFGFLISYDIFITPVSSLWPFYTMCADKIQGLVSSSEATNSVFGYPRATIIYLDREIAYAMSWAKKDLATCKR